MPPGGEPQIVEEAKYRPGRCLASGDVEGPFIDCGRWTREHDPYVQLSVRWFEETARNVLGMVSKLEIDERYAGLEAELKEYAEKVAALERLQRSTVELAEAASNVTGEPSYKEIPAEPTNDIRERVPVGIVGGDPL